MADETATVEQVPAAGAAPARVRKRTRVRKGLRKQANWLQLVRFGLVGASGYVVNLAVFAVCIGPLSLGHRIAAVVAFAVALANNFTWNRHWTFDARGRRARSQAARFCVVSVCAFGFSFGVLELLVEGAGVDELLAQAVAIATATPLNFIGNKLWSFDR
jgi:dolichol-phosphate mannosyltransferase